MFNSVTGSIAGRKGHAGKGSASRARPHNQVIQLQRIAMACVDHPDTPVAVKAAIMRAYVDLQDLRMALEGIGRPKPVEARNSPKRKARVSGPIGPASPPGS